MEKFNERLENLMKYGEILMKYEKNLMKYGKMVSIKCYLLLNSGKGGRGTSANGVRRAVSLQHQGQAREASGHNSA